MRSPYDAFLLTVYAGCPTALDPATAPEVLPQVPINTVELLEWRTYRLRDDLPVPVIVLNSEFEAEQYHPNNQPDTDNLRFWEVAGTAHGGLMSPEMLDTMGPLMGNGCTVSFAPASRAALARVAPVAERRRTTAAPTTPAEGRRPTRAPA